MSLEEERACQTASDPGSGLAALAAESSTLPSILESYVLASVAAASPSALPVPISCSTDNTNTDEDALAQQESVAMGGAMGQATSPVEDDVNEEEAVARGN